MQPALPAITTQDGAETYSPGVVDTNQQQRQDSAIAPAQYIPQPPPQPFSSKDSIDAIALRAAISTLQIQRQKAQNDLRTLEDIKKQAVAQPDHFRKELAAGRLKEHRPDVGSLQDILDAPDSDSDEEPAIPGASAPVNGNVHMDEQEVKPAEVPDSQPSRPATSSPAQPYPAAATQTSFPRIPGPQNVVRTPPINWNKYHIVGEPLDQMHEQQRRWPGSAAYGQNRGREHVVNAPYSPWLDAPDGQQRHERLDSEATRNDSVATPTLIATPTVSEHPMETRRGSKNQ